MSRIPVSHKNRIRSEIRNRIRADLNSGAFPNSIWENAAGYTDTEIVDRGYPVGNVLRYGADPTGVLDSTAAFNLATRSGHVGTGILVTDQFAGTVEVPAGYFKITSAVWVHKGQHLKGEGEGGTNILLNEAVPYQGAIFRLGRSSVQIEYPTGSGLFVDQGDAGGLPPVISGLWTYGGPASHPVVETSAAGASIHDMFLTASGTGIKIDGGDIRVTNIHIDICATGLVVGGRSHTITNVLMYVPNIAIATTVASGDITRYLDDPSTLVGCSDIVFSNIQIFATKFYSIQLTQSNTISIGALGADVTVPVEHSDISFNNFKCQQNQFASNGYENFNSFVKIDCNEARNVVWSDCSFNNMNGPAIRHSTGVGNDFRFNNCIFDGRKTLGNFNQALKPSACLNLNDRMEFNSCTFKNLKDITNEVTLTIGGAVVGVYDPYEKLIIGPSPKIPFNAGIHTITYTGVSTHTAMFAQGSSGATEIILRGGTVFNCLTPTATDSVFVRLGNTPSTSGLSVVSEEDVLYEDSSMSLCSIPTVDTWYTYSDRYLTLESVGGFSYAKVGGSRSNYKLDTTTSVLSIPLPRIDANPKRDPKDGDVLTFIDAEDTWATNNVTFLAGDNFIDGITADFVANVDGSEVSFVYVADTNLAANPPKGNWISRVVYKIPEVPDVVNFNEFGGLVSGDYIAQGYALTSTYGCILLPINSTTVPTSITIVGGFDVVRFSSNVLAASVTLTLNTAISSNRLAILLFQTTGLVEGTSFNLMTQTNASKITVNF